MACKSASAILVKSLLLIMAQSIVSPGLAAPPTARAPVAARSASAQAASTIYAQGVQAYQQGHYNEAALYMYDSITKEKAGANAWLYMANSYYAMGKRKRAEETYASIKANFAGTPQAAMAAQSLQKLNPAAAAAADVTTSGESTSSETPLLEKVMDEKSILAGLRSRLQVVSPVYGHDPVSKITVRTINACFDKIPAKVQALLYKSGVKFVITPTMIDKFPAGAYQEVAGYEGGTEKSCPGLFNGREIVISQACVDEFTNDVKKPIPGDELEGTFLHETGHAVDNCLKGYSRSEDYRHCYYLDIARVPDDVAPKIKYYLQKSVRGQSESWAELTSIILGNNRGHAADLKTYFPNSLECIKKKLDL